MTHQEETRNLVASKIMALGGHDVYYILVYIYLQSHFF